MNEGIRVPFVLRLTGIPLRQNARRWDGHAASLHPRSRQEMAKCGAEAKDARGPIRLHDVGFPPACWLSCLFDDGREG